MTTDTATEAAVRPALQALLDEAGERYQARRRSRRTVSGFLRLARSLWRVPPEEVAFGDGTYEPSMTVCLPLGVELVR